MRFSIRALAIVCLSAFTQAGAQTRGDVISPRVEAALAPPVAEFICVPESGFVHRSDTYRLSFSAPDTIPVRGAFKITFPERYDLGSVTAAYSDNPRPDAPGIASFGPEDQSYWISFDSTGTPAPAGTSLQITLAGVVNPDLAWSFSVALEVHGEQDSLLFGPTLSDPFYLFAGDPAELELFGGTSDTVAAGATLRYTSEVRDEYGNVVESPALVYRVEPEALGNFAEDVFTARKTGSGSVIVSFAPWADTSEVLTVVPGPLASWELTGMPNLVMAGAPASASPLEIKALDAFGNLQYLYRDSIYFSTSDTLANLPATRWTPYFVTAQDSGSVAFPGSSFVWFRSGPDSLHVLGGGARRSTLLEVTPASAVDYNVYAPDTVVAGFPFAITVTGVKDRYGNATSGLVRLGTSRIDSAAPNGQIPSLPAVSATAGFGSTQAALYRAGEYPVFGRLNDSVRQTASITIMPQATASFQWQVSSPLIAGVVVDSPFILVALDPYRNRVHPYASVGLPVLLSSTSNEPVSPSVIAPAAFSAGVADLRAAGFTYLGSGGTTWFEANAGQASGTSPPVEVQALFAESLVLEQTQLRRGVDTLTGSVYLRLLGLGSVVVNGLELGTSQGNIPLDSVSPILPAYLNGPAPIALRFRWPIPDLQSEGDLRITCRTFARFPSGSVVDVCPDSASVSITAPSQLKLVSVVPGIVAYDDVRYLVTLTNLGPVGASYHLDSSHLVIAGGARRDTAVSASGGVVYLGPADTLQLEYLARHASGFAGDTARAQWQGRGTELGRAVVHTVDAPLHLNFVASVQLSYWSGSLSPDTAVVGQADTLRLRIRHAGGVALTGADARLELAGAVDTLRLGVTRSITPFAEWRPGDTTLAFAVSGTDLQLDPGVYRLRLSVSGAQNRIDTVLLVGTDSLWLVDGPAIRIDSLRVDGGRPPRVSTRQNFNITGFVSNLGTDVLDSVRLRLVSDGSSRFSDTLNLTGSVFVGVPRTAVWSVTADSSSHPLESFRVDVLRARGRATGQPAREVPSQRNNAAVQIQRATELEVQARLYSPDDALDGRIAAGSSFQIAGKFINLGEADPSGTQLQVRAGGGVQVVAPDDSLNASEDVDLIWTLRAPDADTTATIAVYFPSIPQDLNTGEAALLKVPKDSFSVRIAFEAPPLRVLAVQTEGGAIDGPYEPLSWTWSNTDATGLFSILIKNLSVEARAADGITRLDASSLAESATLELGLDTIPAQITSSGLRFGTDTVKVLGSGQQETVHLRIWPRLSGTLTEFRWATLGAMWQVVDGAGVTVPVLDERGASLKIVSDLAFIPGQEASNYPNPFKAGSEVTHIQYDLSTPSQVSIAIYATSGHEVWKKEFASGGLGGAAGPNTVDWDGRNGQGNVVVDGVYFAKIQSAGQDATIKIVVMK